MGEDYKSFLDWVVYQIYPKSFLDTNGDGWGDLNGVIRKLDYIRSLGANAIWLCPIYKSPQKDNGYDISSYIEIDERYGTMQDFERLVVSAKEKGIQAVNFAITILPTVPIELLKASAKSALRRNTR